MAGLSRYAQRELLDHVNGVGAYTPATHRYVALLTAGAECAGATYARQECDAWSAASDADPAVSANTSAVTFTTNAGDDWGTITRFAIYDALSGGNLLWDATALAVSKVIAEGDTVAFAVGALELTLD